MTSEAVPLTTGLSNELGNVSVELERVGDLAAGVSRTLSNGLRAAITNGRSFRTVLLDIGRSLGDIALKAALKPLTSLAGNLVENLFAATNPALNGVRPFAKGGVLAAPAYFPSATGIGLAGESGPEAILPLQRAADGRLGVAGGSSLRPISVTLNVAATNAQSFVGAEAEVSAMLLRAVRRGSRAL